nr:MAG TPA: hypothetical protein [Caudoviricetes sp.]
MKVFNSIKSSFQYFIFRYIFLLPDLYIYYLRLLTYK